MLNTTGFDITARDPGCSARCGVLQTAHGAVQTPVFMPVGTQATVKGIWPEQLADVGSQVVLANTYHLALRPGEALIRQQGGLHGFMNWQGPILTDSGGFQVFSLNSICKLNENGVIFRSHIDGALFDLTPERSMQIQNDLGADIIMAFDECPKLPCEAQVMRDSLQRTSRWLGRCVDAHHRPEQLLFGIVQGGLDGSLRKESLDLTLNYDLPGIAIGGLSVGESREERLAVLDQLQKELPDNRPHYLMGVGTPLDLVESVCMGIDMFDCVMPTRDGRHGIAYTSTGRVRIKNSEHKDSDLPLDADCSCPTCRSFSRAYLRHLFMAKEMLGSSALSLHNIAYYHHLMKRVRDAITKGEMHLLAKELYGHYITDDSS